jgi:hypothetical protein
LKYSTFDLMRFWAALTGVVLAAAYFGMLWGDLKPSDILPMLVTAIGGFEAFLFAQDRMLRRKSQHG